MPQILVLAIMHADDTSFLEKGNVLHNHTVVE